MKTKWLLKEIEYQRQKFLKPHTIPVWHKNGFLRKVTKLTLKEYAVLAIIIQWHSWSNPIMKKSWFHGIGNHLNLATCDLTFDLDGPSSFRLNKFQSNCMLCCSAVYQQSCSRRYLSREKRYYYNVYHKKNHLKFPKLFNLLCIWIQPIQWLWISMSIAKSNFVS